MPRTRPDGTYYPSMLPQQCSTCGGHGSTAEPVQTFHGVPAHKRCRVAPGCSRRGCSEPAKALGLCSSHYNLAYYADNADAMRARAMEWYRSNPERVAARYARDKATGVHRDRANRWYWADRLRALAIAHNARARRLGAPGRVTVEQLHGRWDLYGGRCYLCHAAADGFDHVKPFKQGGPHIAANMRPCCNSCNSSKGADWNGN